MTNEETDATDKSTRFLGVRGGRCLALMVSFGGRDWGFQARGVSPVQPEKKLLLYPNYPANPRSSVVIRHRTDRSAEGLAPVLRRQALEHPHDVVDRSGVAGRQELDGGAQRLAFGGEVEARKRAVDGEPFGGLML